VNYYTRYTDVDYKWLESGIYWIYWAGMCVCVCMGWGGGYRTSPSHGLSLTNDHIKWFLACISSKKAGGGGINISLTPPLVIEVSVPIQESERSFYDFLLDFENIPSVVIVIFHFFLTLT